MHKCKIVVNRGFKLAGYNFELEARFNEACEAKFSSPNLDWISPFTEIQKTEVSRLSFSLRADDV